MHYRSRALTCALWLAATFTIGGCSDHQKRAWKPRPAEDNYRLAIDAELGDERRDAVARIAESGYVTSDEAFKVLDNVARTDPVTQNRCIAIRALSGYKDARPIKTLLVILQATTQTDQALAPNDDVRWETVNALTSLAHKGVLTGREPELTRDILIKLAESDPFRNVRICAIQALGEFKDRQVLLPLIRCLRSRDFGIAERAENSLIHLTGETHYYDADAWEKWLSATDSPFAHAGRPTISSRPAGPSWLDQQKRAFRRAIKLGNE